MGAIVESCSECGKSFRIMYPYQLAERDGGFAFFCSESCRDHDPLSVTSCVSMVSCDGCAKRMSIHLAAAVLRTAERTLHACSTACRRQLVAEGWGARLGNLKSTPPPSGPRIGQRRTRKITVLAPKSTRTGPPPSAPTPHAPRRIMVLDHKRGSGKTTTAVSLAAGLAARGMHVLLIDVDAQGDVATSLGAMADRSLYHVLVAGQPVRSVLRRVRPGLDLLPSDHKLKAVELFLASHVQPQQVLVDRLGHVLNDYDYVIMDGAAGLSLMNQNALYLADSVLVPAACDERPLSGVRQVLRTIRSVQRWHAHPLQLWGVLPTFYDERAKLSRAALESLRTHFDSRCLSPIRVNAKLEQAPACARTIFEHAPGAPGSADYKALVNQVLRAEVRELPTRRRAAS